MPAYVYCEETSENGAAAANAPHFKSQIRYWGYAPGVTGLSGAVTSSEILEPAIEDDGQQAQLAPVESQRRWEEETETNVIERLERASLLAPAGDAEAVLNSSRIPGRLALRGAAAVRHHLRPAAGGALAARPRRRARRHPHGLRPRADLCQDHAPLLVR